MNNYIEVLKKYATFDGRARRQEYWMFTLVNVIIGTVLYGLMFIIVELYFLYGLYCLAVLLPSLAVSVRRLHDINKSGLWLLLCFVPLVGAIVLLVWECTDGTPGENRFGPNPKELNNANNLEPSL